MIDTLSFPRLSRAAECSGGYNCSLISPTPSPTALILSHCLDLVVLSVLHCFTVTGYLTASDFSSPVPPTTQLYALAHTNTLQPGFCPYIPLKQFSPSPANLIKTLLLSSDGFWIFILLILVFVFFITSLIFWSAFPQSLGIQPLSLGFNWHYIP